MTAEDRTRTVHFAIADWFDSWTRTDPTMPSFTTIVREERYPDLRGYYAVSVLVSWFKLAVVLTLGLLVIGVPARALFGVEFGNVVLAALLAGSFFCLTGCVNAFWRRYWYVPQATRWLESEGLESERFLKSMRRTLPRNSSLIWQSIVGLLTFVALVVG